MHLLLYHPVDVIINSSPSACLSVAHPTQQWSTTCNLQQQQQQQHPFPPTHVHRTFVTRTTILIIIYLNPTTTPNRYTQTPYPPSSACSVSTFHSDSTLRPD
mmetsp:Transcript_5226/g.5784  ORF Transcript_5226/g.5784 Transcript_5226/m.5784 type:complete len:102 (-) Transcript_5226:150-455(-)